MKRWLAWTVLTITVAVLGGAVFFAELNRNAGADEFRLIDLIWGTSWLAFPIVGTVIASRRPENPVGWLAAVFALPIAVMLLGDEYATYAIGVSRADLPGGHLGLWLSQWLFFLAVPLIILMLVLFPDGKLPSRRWRIFPPIVVAAAAVGEAAAAVGANTSEPKVAENPLFIPQLESLSETMQGVSGSILGALMVVAIASIFIRFRKAGSEERKQVKWFLYGLGTLLGLLLLLFILEDIVGADLPDPFDTLIFVAAVIAPPIGMGIGILRYRLYDIDVVINKTLVYGALAAFITAIYVGIVVGVGALVGQGDRPNLGLSLAATAIVAVAFQPVRQRVQLLANRLVYGERVSPYEAVTSFTQRIAESLSFEEVLPRMAEAAAKGVGGTRASVKMFLPGGSTEAAYFPSNERANSFDRTVNVTHQGETVGEIAVAKSPGDQINDDEERLLNDLASQAGLAMRNLRLTAELKQRLMELEESRKRIVDAQDQERRRMERDIHEGAQRQLIEMVERLGIAKSALDKDPTVADQMLEDLKAETGRVVETVRDLARGIFPPLLSDRGLGPALDSLVQKLPVPVAIEKQSLDDLRFDQEAETAIYFCIRELLQDAARSGSAAPAIAHIWVEDGSIAFEIQNAGARESPLQNMFDRIEALGGSLRVDSQTDGGLTVSGRIPARVRETVG